MNFEKQTLFSHYFWSQIQIPVESWLVDRVERLDGSTRGVEIVRLKKIIGKSIDKIGIKPGSAD